MAIRIDDPNFFKPSQTGTRPFLSINVVLARVSRYLRVHDYLDDLEPFFYCLWFICTQYNGPNREHMLSNGFTNWMGCNTGDALTMARSKKSFLLLPRQYLTKYFQPLGNMFTCMGRFLHAQNTIKQDANVRGLKPKSLERMKAESKDHYDRFIGFIDSDGIKALSGEKQSRKRRVDHDVEEDHEMLRKRRRLSTPGTPVH